MRSFLFALPLLLVACAHIPSPCERTVALRHEFGFSLPKLAVHHQNEAHELDIDVRYHYVDGLAPADAPDFVPMAQEVARFFTHYQPEGDFWEILNQKLADMLMQEQPALADVTITIAVDPTDRLPYHRFSRVTRSRAGCVPLTP
jgi:hypothetical protein